MTEVKLLEKDPSPIHIRNATVGDIPFIKDLLIASWVEHARNNPDLMTEERMRESNVEKYYGEALDSANSHVLIAELEGQLAGMIRADEEEVANFFKDKRILYIDDVAVEEDFRRKGVAQALYDEIEKIAREKGIKRIEGRVYAYNDPMLELLKKRGYYSPYSTWVKILQ